MSPRHRCQTMGFDICVRWSKTIRFRERQLLIPILRLSQGHPLCSVHTYERHILEFPVSQPSPAFLHYGKDHDIPITHSTFTDQLRKVLSHAGFPANKFSGHSFHHGGASCAFRCSTPVELISLQGDWSSDAVLLCIAQPLERRLSVVKLIAQNIDDSELLSLIITKFFFPLSPSHVFLFFPFRFSLSGGLGEPHQGGRPSVLLPPAVARLFSSKQ